MYPRGEGGGLGPWWFEGGEEGGTGSSQNSRHLLWVTRYLLPMLSLHDQSRGPWILLHVVSGPWTSIVAALDGGRSNIAVCRRYSNDLLSCSALVQSFVSLIQIWGDFARKPGGIISRAWADCNNIFV
jgi:hypothetical protein